MLRLLGRTSRALSHYRNFAALLRFRARADPSRVAAQGREREASAAVDQRDGRRREMNSSAAARANSQLSWPLWPPAGE